MLEALELIVTTDLALSVLLPHSPDFKIMGLKLGTLWSESCGLAMGHPMFPLPAADHGGTEAVQTCFEYTT